MPPPRSFTEQMRQDPPQGTVALEECFIMRLPNQQLADQVRKLLKDDQINQRLTIKMDSYNRRAEVVLKAKPDEPCGSSENIHLKGKLVDLPTINEIYKSLDDRNMYKCADLHQMLILQMADEFDLNEKLFKMSEKEEEYDLQDVSQSAMRNQMYAYPHGLLPPFKNVKKNRFRKTAKRKFINSAELEKEVKDLLRDDATAKFTSYDIETEEIDKNEIKRKNKIRKKSAFTLDGKYERVYGNCKEDDGDDLEKSDEDNDNDDFESSQDLLETGTLDSPGSTVSRSTVVSANVSLTGGTSKPASNLMSMGPPSVPMLPGSSKEPITGNMSSTVVGSSALSKSENQNVGGSNSSQPFVSGLKNFTASSGNQLLSKRSDTVLDFSSGLTSPGGLNDNSNCLDGTLGNQSLSKRSDTGLDFSSGLTSPGGLNDNGLEGLDLSDSESESSEDDGTERSLI